MIVALDTMTMIWGIQRAGNKSQNNLAEMQCRAHILLETLQDDKATIIVPSVVVAELLVGVDPSKHAAFIASLQGNFFCPPFDIRATEVAARLFQQKNKLLLTGGPQQRHVLKSDIMIIATAIAAGATRFYSNDSKCRNLAQLANLNADDLPKNHRDAFRDLELRKEFGLPQ